MTPEAKCKKAIRTILDAHGVYYTMPVTGGFGRSGVPDFICCHKGRFFAVEAKADTELTALQKKNLADIAKAGGRPFVVILNSKNERIGFDALEAFLKE